MRPAAQSRTQLGSWSHRRVGGTSGDQVARAINAQFVGGEMHTMLQRQAERCSRVVPGPLEVPIGPKVLRISSRLLLIRLIPSPYATASASRC